MEENTTALNAQQEADAKQESLKNEVQPEAEIQESQDYSEKSLNEILSLFEQMIQEGDQQKLYKNAEPIKAGFYKVLRKEKIASGVFVEPGMGEQTQNPFEEVEKAFKDLYAQYKSSRANFNQEMQAKKEENLAEKTKIIEGIKELREKAEDIRAYVVKTDGLKEFIVRLGDLTDNEREIIEDGCLINYYRNH